MKDFGDVEVEGFKRTGGKKKYRTRKLSRIEEDDTKTTIYTLEINGENKLHNWFGPALINKGQKKKEYYLNGILYDFDMCIHHQYILLTLMLYIYHIKGLLVYIYFFYVMKGLFAKI